MYFMPLNYPLKNVTVGNFTLCIFCRNKKKRPLQGYKKAELHQVSVEHWGFHTHSPDPTWNSYSLYGGETEAKGGQHTYSQKV